MIVSPQEELMKSKVLCHIKTKSLDFSPLLDWKLCETDNDIFLYKRSATFSGDKMETPRWGRVD